MGNYSTKPKINHKFVIEKLTKKLYQLNYLNNESLDIHAKLLTITKEHTQSDFKIICNLLWDSIMAGNKLKNIKIHIIISNSHKFFKIKKMHIYTKQKNNSLIQQTQFFGKTKKYKYYESNDTEKTIIDRIYYKTCKMINKFLQKEQRKLNIINPYVLIS